MAGQTRYSELTFIGRDSGLARVVGRPLKRFLDVQAAGGVVLLIATAIALIWANSPWSESYFDLWHTKIDFKIGDIKIFGKDLGHFVNDGLMALFFFVVGLEIKRELVTGQLREFRNALLPAIAALGGMVVPALVFVAFNLGGDGIDGWGIPMATDIAFAVGIVSLLGPRIGSPLKIFLLTLAIVDDIGAIAVIALFYTDNLSYSWLLTAVGLLLVIWVLRVLRVWYIPIYILVGGLVWWATFKSGVHATIAGVVLGMMTPAKPLQSSEEARSIAEWLRDKEEVFLVDVRWAAFNISESVSVAQRLETALHPITSYIIVPIFALANAGVIINSDVLSRAAGSRVTLGIIAGLVVGKTVGITLFTWIAAKAKVAPLPRGMNLGNLIGLAMVAGIGFTVALFIAGLAYTADGMESIVAEAKIGILVASALAAILGLIILARATDPDDD